MIQSDFRIRSWAERGGIEPFNDALVNPASIDLRMSDTFIVIYPGSEIDSSNNGYAMHKLTTEHTIKLQYGQKYILQPGMFVLASSMEYVKIPNDAAGMVMLKSTPARSGIGHVYAGFIDPGFHGNITFEIFSHVPVVLQPGMRICQLVLFQMTETPSVQYGAVGRYQDQRGPTVARLTAITPERGPTQEEQDAAYTTHTSTVAES